MIRKPIDMPPAVAKAFVRDMKAFFKKPNLASNSWSDLSWQQLSVAER